MSPFTPFQPYIGTSDVSSSCSGILLKTRADAVKTESFDSDNTCQKHQVRAMQCKVDIGDDPA